MRDRLKGCFGRVGDVRRLTPTGQLVRAMIGSRTRDEVSWRTYDRLVAAYPAWRALAYAPYARIEAEIAEVTFADVKARQIGDALRTVERQCPDLSLDFLGTKPLGEALIWLQRLPGVGPKVAAATLNFSTLRRPAFVVDTHILRILRRFNLVGPQADIGQAFEAVMSLLPDWSARDLTELHVMLKRLGQTLCRPAHPRCRDCPLNEHCASSPPGASTDALQLAAP